MIYAIISILATLLIVTVSILIYGLVKNCKVHRQHVKELSDARSRWTKTRYYLKTQSGKQALGPILSIISDVAFDSDPIVQVTDIDMMGLPNGITLQQYNSMFSSYSAYTAGKLIEKSPSDSCTFTRGDD